MYNQQYPFTFQGYFGGLWMEDMKSFTEIKIDYIQNIVIVDFDLT